MPEDIIRYAFTFFGHVQGVGFRFTIKTLAVKHHLTGWVKNNIDGSVSMELQGADGDINRFFVELMTNRFDIEDYSRNILPVDPNERFFR